MDHQLVIDYRGNGYEAHCTCGGWEKELMRARVNGLREVYDRIRCGHRDHIQTVENREAVMA